MTAIGGKPSGAPKPPSQGSCAHATGVPQQSASLAQTALAQRLQGLQSRPGNRALATGLAGQFKDAGKCT